MNIPKKHIQWTFKTNQIKLTGDYDMKGKFLIVPVVGKGKAMALLDEPVFIYRSGFTVIKKNGKDYMKLQNPSIEYKLKKLSMNFENLFSGDKTISKNINEVLNENWKEFDKQFGPTVAQAILRVLHNILENITKDTPYDEILEKP